MERQHSSNYLPLRPTGLERNKGEPFAIFKCTIPSNPEQSMTLAVPASLKTVRSSWMSLFSFLLSVFDCMCHLLCSFTLFVYSFSLFCLSSAHFLSFSSKLHLSGNQTLPSWSLCLSFPWLVFCKTNLCTCFRLTLLSFSLSLWLTAGFLVSPGVSLSLSLSCSCAGLVDVSLMVLFDSPVMRIIFCLSITEKVSLFHLRCLLSLFLPPAVTVSQFRLYSRVVFVAFLCSSCSCFVVSLSVSLFVSELCLIMSSSLSLSLSALLALALV